MSIILVFAKAPVPGQVKTRLCPALGPVMAARIYLRLLERTVEQAVAAGVGPVWLLGSPDCSHADLARLVQHHRLHGAAQHPGDLGERMYRAISDALDQGPRCIVVGSDCIDLGSAQLREADALLEQGTDLVFGPSGDGGYVLVGARRVHPALFRGIPWSTAGVMTATRHAILTLGWSHRELRLFRDLDEPRDLALLPAAWRVP